MFDKSKVDVLQLVTAFIKNLLLKLTLVIKPTADAVEEFNTQSLYAPKKYRINKGNFFIQFCLRDANENANCNVIRSCITADHRFKTLSSSPLQHIKHNTLIDFSNEAFSS